MLEDTNLFDPSHNITATFCCSLEVMHIFGRNKGKIIIVSHKIFLNEFFQHISVDMWSLWCSKLEKQRIFWCLQNGRFYWDLEWTHFLKNYQWFWKSSFSSSLGESLDLLWCSPYSTTELLTVFLQAKFPTLFEHFLFLKRHFFWQ